HQSDNPTVLLQLVVHQSSQRKVRLAAVAVARVFWDKLKEKARSVFDAVEEVAEGKLGIAGLIAAYESEPAPWTPSPPDVEAKAWSSNILSWVNDTCGGHNDPRVRGTIRHIFGNPFEPVSTPPAWPSTVVELAQSVYDGQDGRVILA